MITKAIIPVAGYGTRFLPITKAVEKTMLPVVNRPVVDYIVEDCIKAGVTDIYFIVQQGSYQLKTYYSHNTDLERYLVERNAPDKLAKIEGIHKKANFHYIEQPQDGRYGTAIPPLLAEEFIDGKEQFFVLMGDDFVFRRDGSSELALMKQHLDASAGQAVMAASNVDKEDVSKYGILTVSEKDGHQWLVDIVEKPEESEAPSTLSNISKFIFDSSIFEYLAAVTKDEHTGEFLITDALEHYAREQAVLVHSIAGQYLDCGSPAGLMYANQVVAQHLELL